MDLKVKRSIIAVMLGASIILPNSAMAKVAAEPVTVAAESMRTFSNVSVHDPDVIKVNDTYYVFGSHLAVAKSTDLMNWEKVADGVADGNKVIPNVEEELKETFDWTQSKDLWAPDVIQLPDGKFYMYYDNCKGDSPRSALGVAVADNVEGPYKDLGIFLKSGMWGEISEDGETIYDATRQPNTVDPDVFFDKDGNLWMVYGSFSGGIFTLKLDPATGKPYSGQGYGKKLIGGNHARIEGANMMYSQETGYYYMLMTFGGLDSTGGYNIRVVRSEKPDGPFYDANGNDVTNVKGAEGTLFDDRSIEPFGVKLMGNYQFKREIGDPGTGTGTGYVSPGGTTTYHDAKTGKNYLMFHTRFPNKGENHEVRVHEMVMNKDGWPVVAPNRYAGENDKKVNTKQIAGDYNFVNHGKEITTAVKNSTVLHLTADGKVSGAATGTWNVTNQNQAELTLDGVKYNGVFLRQWDEARQKYTITFSALSNKTGDNKTSGVAVFGVQRADLNDHQVVEAVQQDLSLGDTSRITSNLTLPTAGTRDTSISWSSSDPEAVSAAGVVKRPAYGEGNATVTLTATITKGTVKSVKSFTVTVLEKSKDGLVAEFNMDGGITDSTGNFGAGTVIGSKIGAAGGNISFSDGINGQAATFDGTSGIQLPSGLITGNTYSVSLWVNPDQLTQYTTAFFGAKDSNNWVSLVPKGWDGNTMLWSTGSAWFDGKTNELIPAGQWTHLAFTVNNGNVVVYINGAAKFSGTGISDVFTGSTGVFALGVNWWDTPFKGKMDDLKVYETALTQEQVTQLANQ
ncbi:LamG-like jellyroll fold domain-containing protein [Bacillus sp. USDA818B3_A]|uniref:LamG-like jellyroll fold domain-containing protein n=1 Tax=Bacillus sp. USDA818B3_A TaxID=2698834 RepID=UPI00136B1C9B|nr:family 43 glycosylhydrolase [Bacillus sp. USDA818B3_A]